LPDQAADVLAVRSRLAAKARRVRGVANRQLASIENLAAMEIRERHFGRRDEIEIPVAGNLEQIGLELRQIAGAEQRGAVDEKRRLDLLIAMLARVEIEHEIDKRVGEAGARAGEDREACAGKARPALEGDDPERGAEVAVWLRLEI